MLKPASGRAPTPEGILDAIEKILEEDLNPLVKDSEDASVRRKLIEARYKLCQARSDVLEAVNRSIAGKMLRS